MIDSPSRTSAGIVARVTGALFLVMAVAGFTGFSLAAAMVVPGDAAASAARLLAPGRFELALVGDLVAFLCDVAVAILLYVLLRPASRVLALVAAAFRLVYAAVAGASLLALLAARLLLGATALETAQRQAAALLSLELFQQGLALALVFFAAHLVVLGAALLRTTLLPRLLGVLIFIAGAAYLADSLSALLAPGLRAAMAPVLVVPMTFELVLALWLLVKGVREPPAAAEA